MTDIDALPSNDPRLNSLVIALEKADAETDSRRAAIIALIGIVDYLKSIPIVEKRDLHSSIWKLTVALDDIGRGTISPMFKDPYAGNAHRREAGNDIRQIKAFASYSVELLTNVGIGLDTACRYVADGIRHAGYEIKGKGNTPPWRTVRGWRDGVSKLRPDNVERTVLDGLRALPPATDGMTHAEAINEVSGRLKYLVSKTAV